MNLLGQCEPLYHIHSNTIYLYCFPISMVIFYFFYGIWTLQDKPRLLDLFLINMAVSYFFSYTWTLQVNLDHYTFIKTCTLLCTYFLSRKGMSATTFSSLLFVVLLLSCISTSQICDISLSTRLIQNFLIQPISPKTLSQQIIR